MGGGERDILRSRLGGGVGDGLRFWYGDIDPLLLGGGGGDGEYLLCISGEYRLIEGECLRGGGDGDLRLAGEGDLRLL